MIVQDWTHKNVKSCVESLSKSVRRFYKGQIEVMSREGAVFLVKTTALSKYDRRGIQ